MSDSTSDEAEAQFDKADEILADALQRLLAEGVAREIYGVAMFELGVLALVKVGEDDEKLVDLTREFSKRARQMDDRRA